MFHHGWKHVIKITGFFIFLMELLYKKVWLPATMVRPWDPRGPWQVALGWFDKKIISKPDTHEKCCHAPSGMLVESVSSSYYFDNVSKRPFIFEGLEHHISTNVWFQCQKLEPDCENTLRVSTCIYVHVSMCLVGFGMYVGHHVCTGVSHKLARHAKVHYGLMGL